MASPQYLERAGVPVVPEDLSSHNCLLVRVSHGERLWRFESKENGEKTDVHVRGNMRSNNSDTINTAMLNGGGIALLPSWGVGRDVQRGDAVEIMSHYIANVQDMDSGVYAVYPHTRNVSAKVRAYIDFIAEKFKTEPDFN